MKHTYPNMHRVFVLPTFTLSSTEEHKRIGARKMKKLSVDCFHSQRQPHDSALPTALAGTSNLNLVKSTSRAPWRTESRFFTHFLLTDAGLGQVRQGELL